MKVLSITSLCRITANRLYLLHRLFASAVCLIMAVLVSSCSTDTTNQSSVVDIINDDTSEMLCELDEIANPPESVSAFESAINNDRWQLLWRGGAGVELWSDPDYLGWQQSIVSPCGCNSSTPDRIVFTISGDLGDVVNDAQVWADEIDRAITTSLSKYPSLKQVILQSVVGGPNDSICISGNGGEVRSSVNNPVIDQAIALVVTNHSVNIAVAQGLSPEVSTCSEFVDEKGHLTDEASPDIGLIIGNYYAVIEADTYSCTQVIGFSQTSQWYTGQNSENN